MIFINILLLNHHASAPDVGGGGRHFELAEQFSEEGHHVSVMASSYDTRNKNYYFQDEVNKKKFNDKFEFIRFKTKPAYNGTLGRFLNYQDYKRKTANYREFKEEPDVVIASSVHPFAWMSGYKLSKKYNAKFIVEVRDLWPLSMYEDFSGLLRKIIFAYFESIEKKYYSLADAIITTAPFADEYMEEKYNTNRDKVFHIPHGLDLERFDKNKNMSDEILSERLNNILNNNFCVTYTGALSKSEGLSTFVKNAKHLRDIDNFKFVIVGGGGEKENLENIIEAEELDNVVMIDKQPRDYIPLILKKSDILFCGLMDRKAFKYGISKNKFYDYMAAKKPIVFASNVRGSLITKAKAGITIEPHKPKKLAGAIRNLYQNIDTDGRQYAENGREYVEKYHTTEKIAADFLEAINYTLSK